MSKVNVEELKRSSNGLRGNIVDEMTNGVPNVTDETYQLLKFHGMYQQDDRDLRRDLKQKGELPAYSFMLRSRIPGGVITREQYLAHDDIADRFGNGTLRLTTREAFQVHGVLKGDVKPVIQAINHALLSTISACGDVNRNVVVTPDPADNPVNRELQALAIRIANHLTPKSRAYHEIWLDEEPQSGELEEPIYGKTYLPRKFKIGITRTGDNSIDILTHDIGIVAITNGDTITDYQLYAGGGLGKTHNNEDTFPRLADPVGRVSPDLVLKAVEAMVMVQRDHGNRENRKLSRLKYVLHNKGVDWFRSQTEKTGGFLFRNAVTLPPWQFRSWFGWTPQGNGLFTLGLFVENGRIHDSGDFRLKTALKTIATTLSCSFRITATQDLQIRDVTPAQQKVVEVILADHGIRLPDTIAPLRLQSMACPALPTCGLAISEAERVFPDIITELEGIAKQVGLESLPVVTRMTGCPNGCARPYTAELAFVGRSGTKYEIHAGGSPGGDRLTTVIHPGLDQSLFKPFFTELFTRFADNRQAGESFGDWVVRQGEW
ncbi:MAG: NADPH-dependent assimilatory sulfite reductase hemoprotein subunit [Bacteroidetes bacterium]|nr:NADPH-dependent assimilatory sulfite reductase hemoprotein subunit [Bacteroidota bacterium]